MRFAIIVFPGTNCDIDCYDGLIRVLGQNADYVWHKQTNLASYDCIILPGGFSYGDYLRAGAIARFSPVMKAVEKFAKAGGPVLGICNGFQILTEAGLLPGVLLPNDCLQFRCQWTWVTVEKENTIFTRACSKGQVLKMPINHYEGRYYAFPELHTEMEDRGQIVLRYCDPHGETTQASNPNGSLANIAGVMNRQGNVFGLMPHPERCLDTELGSSDGRFIFESLFKSPVGSLSSAGGKP